MISSSADIFLFLSLSPFLDLSLGPSNALNWNPSAGRFRGALTLEKTRGPAEAAEDEPDASAEVEAPSLVEEDDERENASLSSLSRRSSPGVASFFVSPPSLASDSFASLICFSIRCQRQ